MKVYFSRLKNIKLLIWLTFLQNAAFFRVFKNNETVWRVLREYEGCINTKKTVMIKPTLFLPMTKQTQVSLEPKNNYHFKIYKVTKLDNQNFA